MITFRNVWGVYVLEDTDDDDVAFYCIGIFKDEDMAYEVKERLIADIDRNIERLEDNNEDFFSVDDCTDENVKDYLKYADLNDGIQVRNCTYKIFVSKEVYYR